MKKLLIYIVLLLITSTANAQNFPVQSTVFITPPYSVYLSDYASANSQKMTVNLLLKDGSQTGVQVKLRISIKGNGIELRTKADYAAPPITLSGGVPLQLSGSDLEAYLHPNNLDFIGISKQEFIRTGKLPEGIYQFIAEACEYRRGMTISNQGMAVGWLVLNDPPRWILPQQNSLVTATYPQNVFFSWMPMNTGSPNSAFSTEYQFTLVEIWPMDRNPNDAINSTAPLFQTTTNNTSLLYSAGEPELTPGRKYACRLRARDTQGRDLFKNQGYSETLVFTFGQECKVPTGISHTVTNSYEAEIKWDATQNSNKYILSYSEKNNDGSWSAWYNNETLLPWSKIEGLKAEHTYRYRLMSQCPTLESRYSDIREFETPESDTTQIACGTDLSIPVIDGSPPLQTLRTGDKINVGGFTARITEATGADGTFSGKCVVHVKTFGFWVQSEFTNIGINQSMQVTSGEITAIKGELHLLNIDNLIDSINNYLDDNNNGNPNVGDPYVPGEPIIVIIDGQTVVVTGDTTFTTPDGTVVEVILSGQPPVVIVDGETTEVTTDVLDFDNPNGGGNNANHPSADTAVYSIDYVEFKAYENPNGNKYGFDAYPPDIPQILGEYNREEVLDQDYIVPWQSAEANGMQALVNMHIQTKVPDSIQTRLKVEMNGQPLSFMASPDGDSIRILNLTGQGNEQEDLITASYLNDAGDEIPIGYLNMVSYTRQTHKLVIVPVDTTFIYTESPVQTYLNKVYATAITSWEVGIADKLNVEYNEGEANGLNTSRTFFSSFNEEMNNIIDAMKARGDYNPDFYYLFVLSKAENENLNGLMPFSSNFGFLFLGNVPSETKLYRTIAHELGHGAFKLKHIFDDKGTEKQATENLMDYTSTPETATVLHKYQWDEIIDPRWIAFGWSEEMYQEGTASAFPNIEFFKQTLQRYGFDKNDIKTIDDYNKKSIAMGNTFEVPWQMIRLNYTGTDNAINIEVKTKKSEICNKLFLIPENTIISDRPNLIPSSAVQIVGTNQLAIIPNNKSTHNISVMGTVKGLSGFKIVKDSLKGELVGAVNLLTAVERSQNVYIVTVHLNKTGKSDTSVVDIDLRSGSSYLSSYVTATELTTISSTANEIYNQALLNVSFTLFNTTKHKFTNAICLDFDSINDGKIDATNTKAFTTEQLKIIAEFKKYYISKISVDDKVLFIVDNPAYPPGFAPNQFVLGIMVRDQQYGFIYKKVIKNESKNLERVISHELGHGFNLFHPEECPNLGNSAITNNIMNKDIDNTGKKLIYFQWTQLINTGK